MQLWQSYYGMGGGVCGGVKNKFGLKCFLDDFKCYKAFFFFFFFSGKSAHRWPPPPPLMENSTNFFIFIFETLPNDQCIHLSLYLATIHRSNNESKLYTFIFINNKKCIIYVKRSPDTNLNILLKSGPYNEQERRVLKINIVTVCCF